MFPNRNPDRPPLPERYGRFIELGELRQLISVLSLAYEETHNEKVFKVLRRLQNIYNAEETQETHYRLDELDEFFQNPGAFPFAVRVWMFDLMKKESEMDDDRYE